MVIVDQELMKAFRQASQSDRLQLFLKSCKPEVCKVDHWFSALLESRGKVLEFQINKFKDPEV